MSDTDQKHNGYVRRLAESWRVDIYCERGCSRGTGKTRNAAMASARRNQDPAWGRIQVIWVEKPMGLERAQHHFDLLCYIGSGQYRRDHLEGKADGQ